MVNCSNLAKAVGDNVKAARKSVGLTQRESAQKMGMTQQQYSRFENGVFELNYAQLLEICDMYGISPNDIFDVEGTDFI